LNEFSLIFKYALSKAGIKSVRLRTGVYPIVVAPLELLLPFIIVYFNITSRVVSGRLVIEGDIQINKPGFQVSCINAPEVVNSDLFSAIVISLAAQLGNEEGEANFIVIEDAMSKFITDNDSSNPFLYDDAVNEMMVHQYGEVLRNVGVPLSMALENEKNGGELINDF
jgi:hypothetical protein